MLDKFQFLIGEPSAIANDSDAFMAIRNHRSWYKKSEKGVCDDRYSLKSRTLTFSLEANPKNYWFIKARALADVRFMQVLRMLILRFRDIDSLDVEKKDYPAPFLNAFLREFIDSITDARALPPVTPTIVRVDAYGPRETYRIPAGKRS